MIKVSTNSHTGSRALGFGILLGLLSAPIAKAQIGPVDSSGYLEYRYNYRHSDTRDSIGAHGAALRLNMSTFFWRPWILNARSTMLFSEYSTDAPEGLAKSTILQGGLWLDAFSRSKFPLTIFYEDFDADYDSEPFTRFARARSYGVRQRLSSKRLGTYSLEWRHGDTNALYEDGFSVPNRSSNERWEFSARKSVGRSNFYLASRKLAVDGQLPALNTDSLRHTLRHSFRGGSRFNIQNTFFITDERVDSEFFSSDREFQQLYSIATWRPNTEKRLLVTGRGLFQESESVALSAGGGQSTMALSGTASYQVAERLSLTGALGVSTMDNEVTDKGDVTYQQVGASYGSESHPFLGGVYRYDTRVTYGNRTGSGMSDLQNGRELRFDVGHVLGRSFALHSGTRLDVRGIQRVSTGSDSLGRETDILRSSLHLTAGDQSGRISRYLRLSITDQRIYGDEERLFQLADMQYSLQGNVSRDRSWNLSASAQYGRRSQRKPIESTNSSASLSYSISMTYRLANLFGVQRLSLNSDFRFQSEDYESHDPFDSGFDIDRQRLSSAWRNRFNYRIGLLELLADVDLAEIDGSWGASFRLHARRYFGMR